MTDAFYERIALLFQQNRLPEAKELLEGRLQEFPEDFMGQYYLALVYLQLGDKGRSREMAEKLLSEEPQSLPILELAIAIDLADDKYNAAEEKAEIAQEFYPEEANAHLMMARVKLGQRNYDRALENADKALEMDAENIDAYNLKIHVENLLGKKTVSESIDKALQLDPEKVTTIANHGAQLLRQGKVNEALERLKYALSLDPTNQMARFYMQEALKSKFFPYRALSAYKNYAAKLSSKGSWGLIIGVYLLYRVLIGISNSDSALAPLAKPLVFLLFGLFILTWVMDPLIDLYLMSNPYGKLLLDRDQKIMAQFTGGSLLLALVCVAGYFVSEDPLFTSLALAFFLFMIPLGSFLRPTKEGNRKKLTYFTIGIVVLGLLGIFFGIEVLIGASFIGLFVYQWVVNGMLIKENSRVFG